MGIKIKEENIKHLIKGLEDATKLLQLAYPCPELRKDWLPRHEVMQYLGFGSTQMTAIAKMYGLKTVKVGKRIFYNLHQILEIFNSQLN